MAKIKVLLANYYNRKLISPSLQLLQKIADIVDVNRNRSLTLEELAKALPGIHATIAAEEPYGNDIFAQAKGLLIVARDGVGFDKIDLEAATRHGVLVTRAPTMFDETANFVIGLILAVVRKILIADRALRNGNWTNRSLLLCPGLTEMRLGLVGLGQIGTRVAKRARALGMELLVYDTADISNSALNLNAKEVSLEQLLVESDIVSVHIPNNSQTKDFFDKNKFSMMKKDAYFINTSRGEIVNEANLISALKSGHPAGAGLDVYKIEPIKVENPLIAMDNVVLTPHVAGDTSSSMINAIDMNAKQILDILDGRKPSNLLNPEVWEHARIHDFKG